MLGADAEMEEREEMTYSMRMAVWSVTPSSAKLGIGAIPMAVGFCVSTLRSMGVGEAALLRFPSDITFFKMLDMVVGVELK